jgi:hypothetical protein
LESSKTTPFKGPGSASAAVLFPQAVSGGFQDFLTPYNALWRFQTGARPCLKNVKTPKRRTFFRRSALIFLAIHKVWLRQIALIGEKISCRWVFRHLSNKA